jgi:hypothetical protein
VRRFFSVKSHGGDFSANQRPDASEHDVSERKASPTGGASERKASEHKKSFPHNSLTILCHTYLSDVRQRRMEAVWHFY